MCFSQKIVSGFLGILIIPCAIIQRILNVHEFYYVRWYDSLILLVLFLLIGFVFLASKRVRITFNVNFCIAVVLFLFSLSSLYSSFANREYGMLHVGICNVLILIDIFLVAFYISKYGNQVIFYKTIFYCLLFLCVVNDVLAFILPGRFYGNGQFVLYSKFAIAYLHMTLFALSVELYNSKKFFCILIWLGSICMCVYTGCGTGITCFIAMALVLLLPCNVKMQLCRPVVALSCLFICSVFPFCYNLILNIPFIQHFVVDVLHKSLDLTSRTMIYNSLNRLITQKPFFGFGQENNYNACQKYLKLNEYEYAPDIQNGLLDWVVSYGFIGALLLLLLLFLCLYRGNISRNVIFISLIYAYFVAGSVEIPFDTLFFFIIALYAFHVDEKIGRL